MYQDGQQQNMQFSNMNQIPMVNQNQMQFGGPLIPLSQEHSKHSWSPQMQQPAFFMNATDHLSSQQQHPMNQ